MPAKAILLFLLILFSFAIRIVGLSDLPNGAYWDELDAGYQAFSLLKTGKDYFANPMPIFLQSFADFRTPVALYSIVPILAVSGLDLEAVRLNSVIWSLVSVLAMYVLGSLFFPKYGTLAGLASALIFSISPWHFHYSRLGLEPISLLAIICIALASFLRSLAKPAWLPVSAVFFGLGLYTYSTAKLWIPILLVGISLVYFKKIFSLPKKITMLSLLVLGMVCLPFAWDTLAGSNTTRFSHVSIFTDPTLKSEVNTARGRSLSSAVGDLQVGSSPRLVDKVLNNAPLRLLETFVKNYYSAFSFDFLFIRGDPQLRHSPSSNSVGQLLYPDSVLLILGLAMVVPLSSKLQSARLLLLLLLTAPISASLTRDGAGHASRLINLLPSLTLISALGFVSKVNRLSKIFLAGIVYSVFAIIFFGYYFTQYRLESAKPFQYGFEKIIQLADSYSSSGQEVVIDTRREYALMAYLFYNSIDPAQFQQTSHSDTFTLTNGFMGRKFGQQLFLYPGDRAWSNSDMTSGTTLILDSGTAARPSMELLVDTVYYPGPDKEVAFFVFSSPR